MREILLYFYVPMFPWKDFLMGRIRKIQKHKEERDKSGKFKKQEGKNGGEKKKIFLVTWRFLYSCVINLCPHDATFPQENPLVWELPIQHYSSRAHGLRTITNFWGLIFILW